MLNNLAQALTAQGRDAEALPYIERAAAVQKTRQTMLERLAAKKN
jgi:hypothetical protein